MTREEAYKYFEIEFDGECDWMPDMTELQFKTFIDKVYDSLQATIEAQDIIIKDKSAIMEAMANEKSCNGCTHHPINSNDPYELYCEDCKRNCDMGDNFELHIEKVQL